MGETRRETCEDQCFRHFMLNETQAITVFAVYKQGNTNVNQTFVMVLLDMGKNNCQKLQRG